MTNNIITIKFETGAPCQAPEKYKACKSKGQLFAAMLKDGYTPYAISKITTVRYQQVRNQLMTKGLWDGRDEYKRS